MAFKEKVWQQNGDMDYTQMNDLEGRIAEPLNKIYGKQTGPNLIEMNIGDINIKTYIAIPSDVAFSGLALRKQLTFDKEFLVPPFVSATKDGIYRTVPGNKTIASVTNITTTGCSVDLYAADGTKLGENDWARVYVQVSGKLK